MVERRISGEPIEQIVGWAEFLGIRVSVEEGVFVPRIRSEPLALAALAALPGGRPVVVDLCCGAAPIGMALIASRPVELYCSDIDPRAAACARKNIAGHGEAYVGDLYETLPDSLRGRVDLIVANAPYVPSADLATLPREAREHEPILALDGGADGTSIQRRIAVEAGDWLRPGGILLTETSATQSEAVSAHFVAAGLEPSIALDESYEVAVISGSRPAATG